MELPSQSNYSPKTACVTLEVAMPTLRLPIPHQHWPPEIHKYLNAYTAVVRTLLPFLYMFQNDTELLRESLFFDCASSFVCVTMARRGEICLRRIRVEHDVIVPTRSTAF